MANSQAQFSPPPYSPNPTSPGFNGAFPNKRPRLSPNARSPYASPQMANGQLPNAFPPQGSASNGYNSAVQTETPTTPTAGVMGPPSRPLEEKAPGVDDLSDVLYGSGIDVREEEAALQRGNYRSQGGASFATQSTSFGSTFESSQSQLLDYPHYSQNMPGDRRSFYGAGSFNQPAVPSEVLQQKADAARRAQIRAKQAQHQYEMQDPFLHGRLVWLKLEKESTSQSCRLPAQGLPTTPRWSRDSYAVGPTDGTRMAGATDKLVVSSEGLVSDVVTLISLAAKERMRKLVEDAGTIARGRRTTSHGIVHPDLQDIATGLGKTKEATAESPVKENPLKRSFSESNALPSPVSDDHGPSEVVTTIAYPNLNLQSLSKRRGAQKAWEDKRAEKRSKRGTSALLSADQSRAGSVAGTPGVSTPGEPGLEPPPKMTKKEQKRQADLKASEAQQRENTSSSLRMALGGGTLFGKKKKASWLTSSQPSTDSFVTSSRKSGPEQTPATGSKASQAKAGRSAEFREDREDGKGIQLRDLVHLLEPDLREKKTLARAYNKMGFPYRRTR